MTAAREESAGWYSSFAFDELLDHVTSMPVAPGIEEGFALLHAHGFKIAVVSLTWEFAVEWFADRFGGRDKLTIQEGVFGSGARYLLSIDGLTRVGKV